MKAEVFKALVKNNGCRTFVIEGDFGGGLKVDTYIHGGEGTAQEAVAELGFGIYRTKELAELADWMRSYNAEAAEGRDCLLYTSFQLAFNDYGLIADEALWITSLCSTLPETMGDKYLQQDRCV